MATHIVAKRDQNEEERTKTTLMTECSCLNVKNPYKTEPEDFGISVL